MCGLAGILLFPTKRTAADWQHLRRLFTQTLVFNEARGRAAAGVALIQCNGTFRLFKQPTPASDLVITETYQDIMAQVGVETTCLLGHARMPTKGSPWNNANNHPLLVDQTLGIHNGHIKNDDQLFATLRLPRQAEVDSEILFRLSNAVHPLSHNGQYLPQIRERLQCVEGTFATLSVDLRQPTRLVALKYNNPLCLHYEPSLAALFFSSRYLFLRQAFGRSVITEALESSYAYLFDAERLPQDGVRPTCSVPLGTPGGD